MGAATGSASRGPRASQRRAQANVGRIGVDLGGNGTGFKEQAHGVGEFEVHRWQTSSRQSITRNCFCLWWLIWVVTGCATRDYSGDGRRIGWG